MFCTLKIVDYALADGKASLELSDTCHCANSDPTVSMEFLEIHRLENFLAASRDSHKGAKMFPQNNNDNTHALHV